MATRQAGPSSNEEMIRRDLERLHAMGYAQELKRAMSGFSNFAISFTIISILSGCLTLFASGMGSAGPLAGSIGWPVVSFFVVMVALSMAELASTYPTAGGLYYWASQLGGPAWGWYTGWFNLIGQVAVTAGIDYGMATFVNILLNTWFGTPVTPGTILIIFAVALVLHAAMNIAGVNLVAMLNNVSAWWHVVGVILIVGALLLAPKHHSLGQAFHSGFTTSGFPYWYGFLLGLLLAQYTFTGYDASAHMTEETIGAEHRAPRGVVMSVLISAIAGYVLLMGLLIAMPAISDHAGLAACKAAGYPGATDCTVYTVATAPNSNPVGYILNTALGTTLGTLLLTVAVVAQFFCGMSSITANSRMIYAFSRDGAVPGHRLWHRLHSRFRTPANAIVLGGVCSFLLAVPALWNVTAYVAVTSIATIGLYISYVLPVYLRRRAGEAFQRGVWNLGSWSPLVNWIAIVWVIFTSILFMLPSANPSTWNVTKWTSSDWSIFNYTPAVLIGVLALLTIWWFASVRTWFKGPIKQGSAQDMARIEAEISSGEAGGAPRPA